MQHSAAEMGVMPAWAWAWLMVLHTISTIAGLFYVILKIVKIEKNTNGKDGKH